MARRALLLALLGCACTNAPGAPDGGKPDAGSGCKTNADCSGGLVCDGKTKACGPCTSNGQCSPQQSCDATQRACVFLPGWGDQCALNSDCPLTPGQPPQFCKQGLCVAGSQVTACTRDNCPTGLRCNQQNQVCEQDLGCFSDTDCPPSESCNTGTHACAPTCTAQTVSQVCQPAQMCVSSLCVDCTQDSDCGTGLTCNVAAGRCGGLNACYSNADCPAGTSCDLGTNACGPALPPCLSNTDCPLTTQVCDPDTGLCVLASCQPDIFSPNGTQTQAAPIQTGATYSGLTLCSSTQQSWFSVVLQSGDRIQVTINTDATGSGYSFDVQLRADDGTILTDGNLVLDQIVASSGTYYLVMSDGDAQTDYGFSTLVSHGTPCPPNPYAPDGEATQAVTLDGGTAGPIWLCAGEQQWYVAALAAGHTLTATLGCDPTQGPLTLTLYDSDGLTVLDQNDLGLATETATATHSSGGRVYAVVTGNGQSSNAYTLALSEVEGS